MLVVRSLMVISGVDFLAVEREWSRLGEKGLSSVWVPASQDSSHVGNAGVGVIAQFKSFFEVGRFGVCYLLVLVGLCICLFYMVIRC